MKRLILALLAVIFILSLVVIVRALRFSSRQIAAPPGAALRLDRPALLQRLSRAIRFRTVSAWDAAQTASAEFERFHDFLSEAFPQVGKELTKETIGGHSLLYSWQGQEIALKPILLMAHMDVVPASDESWRHPPFAGALADGYLWGRGAMDDKASVMAILEAVEHLLRDGFVPKRTIYLAFGHDEEVGGQRGAAKIAEHLRARSVQLEFVLDEGLNIVEGIIPGIAAPVALIGIAEKGYLSLRLAVDTPGGHSSIPAADTAIGVISRALHRLEAAPFPSRLNGPTRQMLEFLGPEMVWPNRIALANLWLFDSLVKKQLAQSPLTNAVIRTTLAPTLFHAGVTEDVLPASAAAVINLRLLPGDTVAGAIERVRSVIDEPNIKITPLPLQMESSPVSDVQSPSFELIQRTIRQIMDEALVAPSLLVAATDSRHYAGLTKNIFRFLPITVGPEDTKRYHGIDERISVRDYERLVRFYAQLIHNSQQ
ncbi:MAG: M20 family peptidase [Candidatus Binatia bacterium]